MTIGEKINMKTVMKSISLCAMAFFMMLSTITVASAKQAAFFRFKVRSHPETFVIKVVGRKQIAEARAILESGEAKFPMGTIVKKRKSYNNEWSFHLKPSTIKFVELSAEVCDSSIQGVEDNLDIIGGAMLPGNVWCPWSAELTEEVDVPEGRYFEFAMQHDEKERMVIKLTSKEKIKAIREIIKNSGSQILIGNIVKQPAKYDKRWSYHVEPSSIEFVDAAAEVCDASIQYVEDHLDEVGGALLPGNVWCPWESQMIRELRKPRKKSK